MLWHMCDSPQPPQKLNKKVKKKPTTPQCSKLFINSSGFPAALRTIVLCAHLSEANTSAGEARLQKASEGQTRESEPR